MKNHLACAWFAGTSLFVAMGAMAQTAAPAADPKAIGVTQAAANEANRKAMQDGNAATVVRTGPSAADKAHRAMSSAKHSAAKAKSKARPDGPVAAPSDDGTARN